jgi:predicted RNA-binding Zn-ribbon protein involved in translation (DUF1610 family)
MKSFPELTCCDCGSYKIIILWYEKDRGYGYRCDECGVITNAVKSTT